MSLRLKHWALALFSAVLIHPLSAIAQSSPEPLTPPVAVEEDGKPFKIGTSEIVPFVFLDEEVPYGYEIELWNRIADELALTVEWVPYAQFSEMMADLEAGQLNAAIAGISITASRESNGLDFSYPSYRSGLQLMVRSSSGTLTSRIAGGFLNWNIWRPLLLVMATSACVGALIWVFEHKHNEHFSNNPINGIGQGIWFAVVTLGTFGYGDVTPVRLPGRIVACLWMGASFFIVADFIASMTVEQMADSRVTIEDLQGASVGVIDGTTAEEFGRSQPINLIEFETFEQMMSDLDSGTIDAVIHDYPALQYTATRSPNQFELVGEPLTQEDYGIAFQEGNEEMIEAVNREVLALQEQGFLRQIREKWLGED
ncbi:MAG: transporter substrate-binding domain-containing protein [Phormidesmis sp.]